MWLILRCLRIILVFYFQKILIGLFIYWLDFHENVIRAQVSEAIKWKTSFYLNIFDNFSNICCKFWRGNIIEFWYPLIIEQINRNKLVDRQNLSNSEKFQYLDLRIISQNDSVFGKNLFADEREQFVRILNFESRNKNQL